MKSLRITEIFHSLQGEARTVGVPTVFVRLTGCPLRCGYCDTEYAFSGGEIISLDKILEAVRQYKTQYVCVTGGEPMAQKECLSLLVALCDEFKQVSLETSGALDLAEVDPRVIKVMDLKTPDSNEMSRNLYSNIQTLNPHDQVKFVLCSRQDYDWAKLQVDQYNLTSRVDDVLFSPCHDKLDPTQLAAWILQDKLSVRFQLQLHKILWGDKQGV
ncbi:MAG: 7-carboxy-7-deazaguanine synthase QueE [Paracoccus sp.]|nr:MAG: 7-carboxy-7-deazaguanine synthase QueE [Paracoccus sp. (in: a-proteobacteria)]